MASNLVTHDLIEAVRKRPGLWDKEVAIDHIERVQLWHEVGGELFQDWPSVNKATAYDRVLQLQKKWRSLKDAFHREVRLKKHGQKKKRIYIHFKDLMFLGGHEGLGFSDELENWETEREKETDNEAAEPAPGQDSTSDDPLQQRVLKKKRKTKRNKTKQEDYSYLEEPERVEIVHNNSDESDRLFLLSFVPELTNLPSHLKMWARTQISKVLQEAVSCQYSDSLPKGFPLGSNQQINIKRPRNSDSD